MSASVSEFRTHRSGCTRAVSPVGRRVTVRGMALVAAVLVASPAAAGEIRGSVRNDENGLGAAGHVVFLDQNRNGSLDPGEQVRTTDNAGRYSFSGLAAGTYTVAALLVPGWEQTSPGRALSAPIALPPGNSSPMHPAAGDLDGDGDLDLAVPNWAYSYVTVYINLGGGAFAPGVQYQAGCYPYEVVLGDLDGDGDLDMAVSNHVARPDGTGVELSILFNAGNGTFSPPVNYGPPEYPPSKRVTLGDLDGDGDLDVVTAGDGVVHVYWNDGTGALELSAEAYPVAGGEPRTGDLDNDGDLDVVVTNAPYDEIVVLLNDGDGTLTLAGRYPAGDYPRHLTLCHLNGDEFLDLAVANEESGEVSVLLNQGDGTFGEAVNYVVGGKGEAVASADLDEDGDEDLAVATWDGRLVVVLFNDGDGTFDEAEAHGGIFTPQGVIAADVDGRGHVDLVVTNSGGGVFILANVPGFNTATLASEADVVADLDFSVVQVDPRPEPFSLLATAFPPVIEARSTSTVTARFTDAAGAPVPYMNVRFSLQALKNQGSIDVLSAYTDANGEARTTYTSGSRNGTVIVTAEAAYVAPATVAIVVGSGSEPPATGTISGTVYAGGKAVKDATVTATNYQTNQSVATTTNKQGKYSLAGLPVGLYLVEAFKSGVGSDAVANVQVQGGQTTTVNLNLEP